MTSYFFHFEGFDNTGNVVYRGNSYYDIDTSTSGSIGQYIMQNAIPYLLKETQKVMPTTNFVVLNGIFKL